MSYLVLARKWRPQGFDDLIGQGHIVRILTNSITQGKTAHAYVFSGPRGVGKTTTARILAKALNCKQGPTPMPCGKCDSCRGITDGYSVDVIEIDGASNNSVDDIRDLREKVKYAPSGGLYKVYIIDEAHMLSTSAFNALLKTLEEPPPHVVFVLATTDPRKIPLTVLSRCQHLPFRRVSTETIKGRLSQISSAEGIGVTEPALAMIARAADGSIRDSLTLLDQAASFSEAVGEEEVKALLGTSDLRGMVEMAMAVVGGDRERIISLVAGLVEQGTDLRAFAKDMIKLFRDLLVIRVTGGKADFIDAGEEERALLKEAAMRTTDEHLVLIMNELLKAEGAVKGAFSPRVALEMSLIRISYLSTFKDVKEAISLIGKAEGEAPSPPVPPAIPSSVRKTLPEKAEPAPGVEAKPALSAPPAAKPTPVQEKPAVAPEISEEAVEEPETFEEPASGEPLSAERLLSAIADGLKDNVRLSSMLMKAEPSLDGETLGLTFSGPDAPISSRPVKENSALIEELASKIRRAPTKIAVHVKKSTAQARKTDLAEKVLSEPLVKEAVDLFGGKVLDYNISGEKGNH